MENEVIVQQEFIPVERINIPQLFTNKQEARLLLEKITAVADKLVADVTTAAGRKAIASNAYEVSRCKTFLDGLGKDFVSDIKQKAKTTDDIRKFFRDELDSLRDAKRKPLTDYEEAEKARIAAEEAERQYLSDWDEAISINDLFDREREIARKEAELKRQEEERIAKEAAERAKQERIEREKRIAQEAADRAKREAEEAARVERERVEREKREAEERIKRAEQERIAAIERAKLEAEQAERDRIQAVKDAEDRAKAEAERKETARLAREAADKAEADRLARNKAHRKEINNAALASFELNGIDSATAKKVLSLIAKGLIDFVTINY